MVKQCIAHFHFRVVYLYINSSIFLFSFITKTKKFTEIILILRPLKKSHLVRSGSKNIANGARGCPFDVCCYPLEQKVKKFSILLSSNSL